MTTPNDLTHDLHISRAPDATLPPELQAASRSIHAALHQLGQEIATAAHTLNAQISAVLPSVRRLARLLGLLAPPPAPTMWRKPHCRRRSRREMRDIRRQQGRALIRYRRSERL